MPILVHYISADWCKRCHTIQPTVVTYSKIAAADLIVLDYEEMEEAEKATITSLPTIRMKLDTEWVTYTNATITDWVSDITSYSSSAPITTDF